MPMSGAKPRPLGDRHPETAESSQSMPRLTGTWFDQLTDEKVMTITYSTGSYHAFFHDTINIASLVETAPASTPEFPDPVSYISLSAAGYDCLYDAKDADGENRLSLRLIRDRSIGDCPLNTGVYIRRR